uniref:hypothetical protein n=1 Tax=Bartonella TaxID=773 RepID=UPI00236171D5
MNKLYTKLAGSELKFSRFPFIKVVTVTSIAALLSSVFPVFSKNLSPREGGSTDIKAVSVVSSQSVISVYDDSLDVSKDNYITVSNTTLAPNAHVLNDYANFLTRTLSGKSDDNSFSIPSLEGAYNSVVSENATTTFSMNPMTRIDAPMTRGDDGIDIGNNTVAVGKNAKVEKKWSVAVGHMAHALGQSSVAVGGEYNSDRDNDYTTAKGDYSIAVGAVSKATEYGSTALGHRAYAFSKNAISIGFYSEANGVGSIALGSDSNVIVEGGVAIGNNSVSKRTAGIFGYAPSLKGEVATNATPQWKSTRGAVSVGDFGQNITRQIIGVAAGSKDTDAVNVGQLKDLKTFVKQNGWKLSVGGKNGKTVLIDDEVDFSAGSRNFQITKGDKDNKVQFDLAKDIALDSVKAGTNTFDATGLVITDGPKITTGGIDAGNRRITDIEPGDLSADSQDAVNGSQLSVVATHIAGYLGGGVKFTSGQWDDAKFTIKTFNPEKNEVEEESFSNVAKAFEGVGKSYVNLHNEIKKAADGSVFKWNAESESIKIAASEEESGQGSIAIGKLSSASGENNIALGGFSNASGENSIALGGLSAATAKNSMALGSNVQVLTDGGVAVGYKSSSRNSASIVGYDPSIGSKSTGDDVIWKSTQGAFSIGDTPNKITRQLTGVAAGYADTDAVNIAQLKKLREFVAQGWTLSLNDEAVSGFQPGDKLNLASGSDNLKIKSSDKKDSISKEITFDLAKDVTLNSVKLKDITLDTTGLTIENGPKIAANGIDAGNKKITGLAGGDLNANSTDAVNGGQIHTITEDLVQILGGEVSFDGKNFKELQYKLSTIDEKGEVTDKSHTDVGSAFKGLDDNIKTVNARIKEFEKDVSSNGLNWDDSVGDGGAYNAAHGEKDASKIVNVADGKIEKDSHEAITGSQLYSLGDKVAEYFGGDAKYENGVLNKPTFKLKIFNLENNEVEEKSYNNVAEAFDGIDKNVQNIVKDFNEKVTNITQEVKGDALLWDSKAQSFAAQHGEGEDRKASKITSLAAGSITSASSDAINGDQLHTITDDLSKILGDDVSFDGKNFKGPKYDLSNIDKGGEVTDKSHTDVGSAFKGLDDNIKNVNARIKEVSEGVAQDSLSWSKDEDAFVAQHGEGDAKGNSKIKSLKDGDIAVSSTDAINGSQLYSMNKQFVSYLDGNASYDEEGKWKEPTFTLKTVKEDGTEEEQSYPSVAEAFAGVGTSFKNIQNKITNDITNQINETKGDALLWNNDKGAFIAQHGEGEGKTNSKITFLTNGDITENSTDAINGSQLYSMNKQFVSYLDGNASYDEEGKWKEPTFTLKTVKEDGTEEEQSYPSVAEAFAGVGTSFKNIQNKITNDITNQINETKGDALLWNNDKGAFIAQHGEGEGKTNSKITFL